MTRYLTLEQLLYFGRAALGGEALMIRDAGLVESALHRPQATVFEQDAYPDIWTNHAFVDGNKRTALAATYAFLQLNGHRVTMSNDEAVDLVLAVATSQLADVSKIADVLRTGS